MSVYSGSSQPNAEEPNICPHCHSAITPKLKGNFYYCHPNAERPERLYTIWECPNTKCERPIFVEHENRSTSYWRLDAFLNGLPKGPDWPKPIAELKHGVAIDGEEPQQSKFIKTYLQSLEAESKGLDELAGMGYRKAIEYLVKDWAIQGTPDDFDKIQKMALAQVIKNYYEGDLQGILSRATWLGNDQTHYTKLFEEYNLEHLKELIALIMVELDRQFKMKHYLETIEPRK